MKKQIIKNRYKACSGCSCVFVPISKTKAVKLYYTKSERDYALKKQARAYKLGFGPKPYNKVFFHNEVITWSDNRYGYVTQIAKEVELSEKEFNKLETLMLKHKFRTVDITFYHNVGKIGKKPVCIDFDMNSL